MNIENLTGEIEEWLEKADEEENLKFMIHKNSNIPPGAIVIELLGYYGSIGQLVAKELQKVLDKPKKIAGVFSNYFNEMVQINAGEILLPISLLYAKIEQKSFIFTTTNFAIPDVISYQLAENLFQLYQELKVSKIILVDGVFSNERDLNKPPQVMKINALSKIKVNAASDVGFNLMGQVASSFLTYWAQPKKIPIDVIAVESLSDYDPISSLEELNFLSKEYLNFYPAFNDLEKQIEEFRSAISISDRDHSFGVKEDSDTNFFV